MFSSTGKRGPINPERRPALYPLALAFYPPYSLEYLVILFLLLMDVAVPRYPELMRCLLRNHREGSPEEHPEPMMHTICHVHGIPWKVSWHP